MNDSNPPFSESVETALSTTRSVRRRLDLDRAIERDELLSCVDVAVQAPVSMAGENWRFLIVTETGPREAIAQVYGEILHDLMEARGEVMPPKHVALIANLRRMPAMVFVCAIGAPRSLETAAQLAWYGSILPAAWSLMVALRARGIGSTWTTLLANRETEVQRLLGMPANAHPTVMLPCAYMKGATLRRADRAPARSVTYLDHWGHPA